MAAVPACPMAAAAGVVSPPALATAVTGETAMISVAAAALEAAMTAVAA